MSAKAFNSYEPAALFSPDEFKDQFIASWRIKSTYSLLFLATTLLQDFVISRFNLLLSKSQKLENENIQ